MLVSAEFGIKKRRADLQGDVRYRIFSSIILFNEFLVILFDPLLSSL